MVLRHPLNGRLALYGFNGGTCRVLSKEATVTAEELDSYELDATEDSSVQEHWRSLLPFVTSSEFTIKWEWTPGDLVLWDNRCTMHCATG
ncbi:tauD, partial [Symbiodinium pilosum]